MAAAKALSELGHLECWVMKQANLTSSALSDLLQDGETTRWATLQNRAAIDFLLLAHGHGCEDFEGMCCFNLSSRSKSIHASIAGMRKLIQDVQFKQESWVQETLNTSVYGLKKLLGVASDEAKDWIKVSFKNLGLSGWWFSVLKDILFAVFIVLFVILALRVLMGVILSHIQKGLLNISRVEISDTTEAVSDSTTSAIPLPWFEELMP